MTTVVQLYDSYSVLVQRPERAQDEGTAKHNHSSGTEATHIEATCTVRPVRSISRLPAALSAVGENFKLNLSECKKKTQTTAMELRASITRRVETHRPMVEEYRRLTCRAIGHPENQQTEA